MGKKFLTDIFNDDEADVITFGILLNESDKKILESIRNASWFVEIFDLEKKKNLFNLKTADIGDIEVENLIEISNKVNEILEKRKIPLMLSYSHLPTLYSFSSFPKNTKLIVFDAHSDLADEYADEKIPGTGLETPTANGATWLRRLSERIDSADICIIGLRSCDEEIFEYIERNKILYITSNQIKDNIDSVHEKISKFVGNSNFYISLDVDVFDPSVAPAVDYPEPDGITFNQFKTIINGLERKLVGMDACCLKPIEGNHVTEFLAVRSIFEILGRAFF